MATPKPLGSVSRAISIVEYLATKGPDGVPLGTIAREMEINKATVYTTLATLREHRWVEQDESSGYYRLGDGIAPLAEYRSASEQAVEMLRPFLSAIGTRFNELVHLGRLAGTDVIYLDKIEPDRPIRVVSEIGRKTTAVTTSLGRALIGALPDREKRLEWFLTDPALATLSQSRKKEIADAVTENFARLDRDGWTEEVEENEPGIACVAVPLVGAGAGLAVSVTAPVERMTPEYRHAIGVGLRQELDKAQSSIALHTRPVMS